MPRPHRQTSLLAVPALLLVAACGGDSTTTEPTTVTLTASDRVEAAAAVSSPSASTVGGLSPDLSSAHVAGVVDGVSASVARSLAVASAATIPVDRSVACPAGGTSRVTGTITGSLAVGGNGSLATALTQTMAACGIAVDGRTLLLSSSTGLAVTGSYAVVNRVPAPQHTLTMAGTVQVSVSGSRAPAVPCAVELSFVTTIATRTTAVSGNFCGTTVNKTYTWPTA